MHYQYQSRNKKQVGILLLLKWLAPGVHIKPMAHFFGGPFSELIVVTLSATTHPLQRPTEWRCVLKVELSKFTLWHCCDMCICDFTRLNVKFTVAVLNVTRAVGGLLRNRSPQRTKRAFWSCPSSRMPPRLPPHPTSSLLLFTAAEVWCGAWWFAF